MDVSECEQHQSHHFALLLRPALPVRLDCVYCTNLTTSLLQSWQRFALRTISNKTADVSLGPRELSTNCELSFDIHSHVI